MYNSLVWNISSELVWFWCVFASILCLFVINSLDWLVIARSPRVRDVVDSNPGRLKPKTLKLVFADYPLSTRITEYEKRLIGSELEKCVRIRWHVSLRSVALWASTLNIRLNVPVKHKAEKIFILHQHGLVLNTSMHINLSLYVKDPFIFIIFTHL